MTPQAQGQPQPQQGQHQQGQPPQFGVPFYPSHSPYSSPYGMHPAYYHAPIVHGPPLLPGHGQLNGQIGQIGLGPSYPRGPPPQQRGTGPQQQPGLPPYQSLDSRGSLSSYGSTESLGASGRRGGRHHNRRGNRRGGGGPRHHGSHNHHPNGGGGGDPPNRTWYRYDDSTTLRQMRGRIVEIAKDRDGSKFVQRRLQAADPAEVHIAFEEAVAGMDELWNDVYGNYILQGLLELGTDDMRDAIAGKLVDGGVVGLSTKVYGCRLVQKALDTLGGEDVARIVSSVKGKVWLLVHDHNGNHVVQKAVTKINELFHRGSEDDDPAARALLASALDVIVDEVVSGISDLSVHPYGCRVVQRLIENCTGEPRDRVLDGVVREGLHAKLADHEYGNYVVQRVLAYGRAEDRAAVFDGVRGNVLELSGRKHSSNVVEMMLTYGDVGQRRAIVDEVVDVVGDDGERAAVSMAGNAYANYVLKTVLDILEEGPTRERLFGTLIASLPELVSRHRSAAWRFRGTETSRS